MLKSNTESVTGSTLNKLILAVCFSATLFLLGWVLYFCQYGIDFTDESFYIVWASNPFSYPSSTTQFGFIYNPILRLVGNDISLFRQINILFTFCLAWIFGYTFLTVVFRKHCLDVLFKLTISSALATSALLFIQLGLRTPSYNSLNLQALLIAVIGILLFERRIHKASVVGALLIGFGGWLAFMAKPPTAMVLGLCILAYFVISKKFHIKLILLSIVSAVLLLFTSSIMIDGSIFNFITRLQNGIALNQAMGGGYTIFELLRIDSILLGNKQWLLLFLEALGFTAITLIIAFRSRLQIDDKRMNYILFFILLFLVALQVAFATTGSSFHYSGHRASFILSIPLVSALVAIIISKFKVIVEMGRDEWSLLILLAFLPHAYAFGTNLNYWQSGGYAGIFWVFSGLLFLCTIKPLVNLRYLLLTLSAMVQLVTIANIQTSFELPYRQPQPLSQNETQMTIGRSELILPKSFADYLTTIIELAGQAGYVEGMPIIDLSGRSPGVLYALGAHNTGYPWMIGGYPGSFELAKMRLDAVSCTELVTAWVLYEPKGRRAISGDVLMNFGANIEEDYISVGHFTSPVGAGGYYKSQAQILLKPSRDKTLAINNCELSRVMTN